MPAFIVAYLKMASYAVFFQCRHARLHIKHLAYSSVEVKDITFSCFLWHIQLFGSVLCFPALNMDEEIFHLLPFKCKRNSGTAW